MEFINPFSVECELCKVTSAYDVQELLAYKSTCVNCGEILKESPDAMHDSIRKNRVELWQMYFLLDVLERYDIDVDVISEEELDSIRTVGEAIDLVKRVKNVDVSQDVLSLDSIKGIVKSLSLSEISNYTLHQLALIAEQVKSKE